MLHAHLITDPTAMADFVKAGRAYFTLVNTLTGGRVTYCVENDKDVDGAYIVRSFTGSDNADRKAYTYLGNIDAKGVYAFAGHQATVDALIVVAEETNERWLLEFCKNIRDFLAKGGTLSDAQKSTLDRKYRIHKIPAPSLTPDDVKAKGFKWFWKTLTSGKAFPAGFEFWHEGRCGRCGRRLTVPESIENGIGPECLKNMGGEVIVKTHAA